MAESGFLLNIASTNNEVVAVKSTTSIEGSSRPVNLGTATAADATENITISSDISKIILHPKFILNFRTAGDDLLLTRRANNVNRDAATLGSRKMAFLYKYLQNRFCGESPVITGGTQAANGGVVVSGTHDFCRNDILKRELFGYTQGTRTKPGTADDNLIYHDVNITTATDTPFNIKTLGSGDALTFAKDNEKICVVGIRGTVTATGASRTATINLPDFSNVGTAGVVAGETGCLVVFADDVRLINTIAIDDDATSTKRHAVLAFNIHTNGGADFDRGDRDADLHCHEIYLANGSNTQPILAQGSNNTPAACNSATATALSAAGGRKIYRNSSAGVTNPSENLNAVFGANANKNVLNLTHSSAAGATADDLDNNGILTICKGSYIHFYARADNLVGVKAYLHYGGCQADGSVLAAAGLLLSSA